MLKNSIYLLTLILLFSCDFPTKLKVEEDESSAFTILISIMGTFVAVFILMRLKLTKEESKKIFPARLESKWNVFDRA